MCLVGRFEKRVTSPDMLSSWAAKVSVKLWIKVTSMGGSTTQFRFPIKLEVVCALREGERCMDNNFLETPWMV